MNYNIIVTIKKHTKIFYTTKTDGKIKVKIKANKNDNNNSNSKIKI